MNKLALIVAKGKDNAIGKDNELLWRIKDDLRLFKKTTNRHVVIHGRKSFESIGKPLPNRTNIIITRDRNYKAKGAFVTHSLEEAIALGNQLEQNGEVFILGGAQIYNLCLPLIDTMYISHVDGSFPNADAHFPAVDLTSWNEVSCDAHDKSEVNEFSFTFCKYIKD